MKFITEKELELSKPSEPKYLRLKIFIGMFITATIFSIIISGLMLFLVENFELLNGLVLIIPFFISYLILGLFSIAYINKKVVFMAFSIVQK